MILSTTPTIEGRPVRQYLGVVAGETIMGANMLRDFFAGITDMIGGRSGTYEAVLQKGREAALDELADRAGQLGADAVVGIAMHYAALGASESMLMVTVSGTAVKLS